MVEKYLEQSVDSLYKLLPEDWEKVVLYAEIDEFHYNVFFYVKYNGVYRQCYDLEKLCGTTEQEIDDFADCWYEIALRNKKKEDWKAYTLIVKSSGDFEVEYSYEDEFSLDTWKKKFLV